MADIGDLGKLVLAQNVKLMFDNDTRVLSMRQVRVPKTHPESRFNYGLDRNYQHGAPDIGISFTVSVTSDIMEELEKRSLRNDKGIIKDESYKIEYTGIDGEKNLITVMGKLRDVEYIRNDSDQQNPVTADCFIRVTNVRDGNKEADIITQPD